jgi:hypothetical protein
MFIALATLTKPRSVRSKTYGGLPNQPKHFAPPERRTITGRMDYKHLAPQERKQDGLSFEVESTEDVRMRLVLQI